MQPRNELVKYVRKILGDIPEVEDVVQDALLSSWEKAGALQNPELHRQWLFKIAKNKALDLLKNKQRRRVSSDVVPDIPVEDQNPDALAVLAANNAETYHGVKERFRHEQSPLSEIKEYLQSVIPHAGNIPDAYLEALLLDEFSEFSQQEIADKLQIPLPTAKSRIQRGRQKAREALQQCCTFEYDSRGSVMDFTPNQK